MKSLNELKEIAKGVFKVNPEATKLLAVEDGQIFLEDKKNAAELHAQKAGKPGQPLKIHVIELECSASEDGKESLNAKESIEKINGFNTVEEVEAFIEEEERATVLKAAEKRIKELSAE